MKSKIAAVVVVFGFLFFLLLISPKAENKQVDQINTFDTSILETWCGKPMGTIRMVGAWYYEDGIFEDETGNLWGWDGEIEEQAFYLLWIDDLGDDIVQNDEILKVWQEK